MKIRLYAVIKTGLVLGMFGALAACSSGGSSLKPSARVLGLNDKIPEGGGYYKIGTPYTILGRKYYPREDPNYKRSGVASWYGADFHGRKTANGEIYDMNRLSAAHRTMPMPSYAKVTNLENGRAVVVRVNDRGPYAHDREIDMSKAAAKILGFTRQGTARVQVEYIGKAPLDGDGERLRTANARLNNWQGVQTASISQKRRHAAKTQKKYRRRGTPEPAQSYAAAGQGSGYFIQTASFSNPESARILRDQLSSIASASIQPANLGQGTYYRVRLGPMRNEDMAYKALARVRAAGHNSARIVMN